MGLASLRGREDARKDTTEKRCRSLLIPAGMADDPAVERKIREEEGDPDAEADTSPHCSPILGGTGRRLAAKERILRE